MLPLARNGYTASQVDAALHASTRQIRFRYDLLDSTNAFKKTLTTVIDGSISYDTTQQIKRTAQFTLQDDGSINYLSDRIQPFALLQMDNKNIGPNGLYVDVSTGKETSVTASSQYNSSYAPGYAVDGNGTFGAGTGWASASGAAMPQWIQFDCGSVINLGEFKWINGRNGGNSSCIPKDYKILISNTGQFSGEETIAVTNTGNASYNWVEHVFAPIMGRYVRMQITAVNGGAYAELAEIQVYQYNPSSWVEFPLGVFLLSTPPRQTDSALIVTRQIDGYDLNQILVDWKTTDRMTIPAGTNYIVEVKSLLEAAGITDHNLTATTYTLPVDLDYAGGTSYLTIINDLMKAINYRTLWFDADGVAVALPWANPSTQPASYTYVDDSKSVIYPQVNQLLDLFAVPNVWVVVVAQTDTAEIVSTYTNSNPNSPTSTVNRGREIVHYEQNLKAPLREALDQFAAQLAFTDSQVYETVVFPSAIMPFHEDYDVLQLTFSALGISDKYSEVAWSFPLVAGGQMSHSVRKVVSV